MEMNWILIRYGEIGLKSDYVRRSFEDRLINNIRNGLETHGIDGKVKRGYGRIFVSTEQTKKATEVLKRTFGIVSFSPCKKLDSGIEDIVECLVDLGKETIKEKDSFAVRVRRTGNHGFSSKDVEERAGAEILEKTGASVDLDNPDKRVMADIRQGQAYIFGEKIQGPAGLPLGTQGRVVSLFNGNCSSFLATWMMMKRGCSVVLLHGTMEPYAPDETYRKALDGIRKWSHGSPIKTMEFDLGRRIFELSEEGERGYTCVLCRRLMHRVASRIAKKTGSDAIITGDKIGNSLGNIGIYDSVAEIPVIRPLIGLDKETVRNRCKDLAGEFILKNEGCEAMDRDSSDVVEEEVVELEEKIDVVGMSNDVLEEVLDYEDTEL